MNFSAILKKFKIKKTLSRKETIISWLLLSIPLIWWCLFFLYPFFMSFFYSFTNLKLAESSITKIGLFQYQRVLTDKTFYKSLLNTGIWTILMMIGNNFFGLLLALLISRLKHGKKLFIALLFWPTLVSAIVGSKVTKMVFSAERFSLANIVIGWFGKAPVAWLENPGTALISLMIMPFFFGFSIKMIIYYTSLLSLPDVYYEAYDLESTSKFKKFTYVTFPALKNAFVLNILLSIIDGLKVLGPMQLITNGGPDDSTLSSMLYIYQRAFMTPNKGLASAAAFILFAIILIVSLIQMKLSGKEADTYE